MVSTWWHLPIVIKDEVLWRKLPLEQRKSNCFKEEGMPISINIIACLECSCHLGTAIGLFWQNTSCIFLLFFFPFSHFSQMHKATHFVVLGHICYDCCWILTCIILPFQKIELNWRTGRHTLQRIHCRSETSKGVYCLQYDDEKIVSGLRDNTIKVWPMKVTFLIRNLGCELKF
jgi:hypothetical protein